MIDTLQPAIQVANADGLTHWYGEHTAQLGGVTYTVRAHTALDDPTPLYVKPTVTDDYIQVDLASGDGVIYGYAYQARLTSTATSDDEAARTQAEAVARVREAIQADGPAEDVAERVVAELMAAGWGPAPVAEPEDWDDWPEGDDD